MKSVETGEAASSVSRRVTNRTAYALEFVVVTASYAVLGDLVQWVPSLNPAASPCWPPTGFALALVLLCGYRIWPAILLGSFLSGAMSPLASGSVDSRLLASSAIIGAGTVLAALSGAWLLKWPLNRTSPGRNSFETPRGIVLFALIAFAPVAMVASLAAFGGLFLTNATATAGVSTWIAWWLADAAGSLVVAPAIMLWALTPLQRFSKSTLAESAASYALAAVVGALAFSPAIGALSDNLAHYQILFGFLVVIPLLWTSLRGAQKDAATVTLIFCGIAVWGLSQNGGALAQTGSSKSLLLLAIALSTSLSALIASAATGAHQNAQALNQADIGKMKTEIAHTKLALDSSRRLFHILIEGVSDYCIFVVDTNGHVASWNSAAQQITGYSAEEILGQHFGVFYRPDERRAGDPNRALEMATRKGKYQVEGWRIKKNGGLLFVSGSVSVVRDDNDKLVGFANILRDTTERRAAQEKLFEAREQLAMAQKMEAIGKLTGGIAHDFNNLLMIIGGNAQTFKRLLDPKLPRAIEAIQIAAKRGESLTRQLLTFARRQHLSPTVVDLKDCIRDMRTMIESSLRGNIVYNERIEQGLRPVRVDLAEFELAIVNIAVNARDAMPNGGTFGLTIANVTVNRDEENAVREFVAIEITDTGTGIPPNLLSKIFDPFFTTKEVGKGTGLGLSQVYGFAHQSGGMVTADSKVGHGTSITLCLPALAETEIAHEEAAPKIEPAARPAVLIVDDSAEVAEVTSSLFEDLGYATVYRESADAALRLLADGAKVDLVFSDIVMPGTIDGVGLASEIKSHYPNLPVILTTGYSDAAHAAPAHLRILRKPFDSNALKGFIREAMEMPLTY